MVITDHCEIEKCILGFYKSLYSSNGGVYVASSLMDFIPKLVTKDDNLMLIAVPSCLEVRHDVFGLNASSATGPDGFNGTFYHKCWPIIQLDVCNAVQEFFRVGAVHKFLNTNLVVLIRKAKGANYISQFRPIALSNFLFKIIPKIFSARLSLSLLIGLFCLTSVDLLEVDKSLLMLLRFHSG